MELDNEENVSEEGDEVPLPESYAKATRKLPPVIINGTHNWEGLLQSMRAANIKFERAKTVKGAIKVFTNTLSDYNRLRELIRVVLPCTRGTSIPRGHQRRRLRRQIIQKSAMLERSGAWKWKWNPRNAKRSRHNTIDVNAMATAKVIVAFGQDVLSAVKATCQGSPNWWSGRPDKNTMSNALIFKGNIPQITGVHCCPKAPAQTAAGRKESKTTCQASKSSSTNWKTEQTATTETDKSDQQITKSDK